MALETGETWESALSKCFGHEGAPLHLLGVGNPVGKDDSVGIYIISALRRRFGASPTDEMRIHSPSLNPERTLSKASGDGRVVIFDAVDCNGAPGSRFCARLADSKVGFFVTHNIPLRLVPGVEASLGRAWVVGVQPEDTGVGEGLTTAVRRSADALVAQTSLLLEENWVGRA